MYPSPPLYYPDTNDYFGSPPEYYSAPVPEAVELINSQKWLKELISNRDLLDKDVDSVSINCKKLSKSLSEISKKMSCDVSEDLSLFFNRLGRDPKKYRYYLNPLDTMEIIQKQWETKENYLFNKCKRQLFNRLKDIFHKLKAIGFTETQLKNPSIWHRYGVFKSLPKCTLTEVYFDKHKFGLTYGPKNLYYLDSDNQLQCNINLLSATDTNYKNKLPLGKYFTNIEDALSKLVLENICDRLKAYGFWKFDTKTEQTLINVAKCHHTKLDYKSMESQEIYAIRDYVFSWLYEDYKLPQSVYELEKSVNHNYRIRSLEKSLGKMLDCWIGCGAPKPIIKGKTDKYRNLIIWKSLTKKKRRDIAHQYIVKLMKQKVRERIEEREKYRKLLASKHKRRVRNAQEKDEND